MGKGHKQASSSQRAAELLSSPTGTLNFVGFETLGPSGLAAAGAVDDSEQMSGEMRMLIAKLRKRDSTTKLKTLGELSAFIGTCEEDDLRALLTHVPRLFNRLAMVALRTLFSRCSRDGQDSDRRVREATQKTMAVLAARAGKLLAPLLKDLIGVWLCAQYDSHRDVAQLARQSFETLLPADKRKKTFSAFRAQIIGVKAIWWRVLMVQHVSNAVLTTTVESLADAGGATEDPVDLAAKYERIVGGSMLVLAEAIAVYNDDALVADCAPFLTPTGIFRFAKHDSGFIRASLYTLSGAIVSHQGLRESLPTKTIPSVLLLNGLADVDAAALRAALEALAKMTRAAPQLWTALNSRKAVLPALTAVLRDGGRGVAEALFGMLPALLAAMPEEVFGSGSGFLDAVLAAMRQGVASIRVDRSALLALHRAYDAIVAMVSKMVPEGAPSDGGSQHWGELFLGVLAPPLTRTFPHPLLAECTVQWLHRHPAAVPAFFTALEERAAAACMAEDASDIVTRLFNTMLADQVVADVAIAPISQFCVTLLKSYTSLGSVKCLRVVKAMLCGPHGPALLRSAAVGSPSSLWDAQLDRVLGSVADSLCLLDVEREVPSEGTAETGETSKDMSGAVQDALAMVAVICVAVAAAEPAASRSALVNKMFDRCKHPQWMAHFVPLAIASDEVRVALSDCVPAIVAATLDVLESQTDLRQFHLMLRACFGHPTGILSKEQLASSIAVLLRHLKACRWEALDEANARVLGDVACAVLPLPQLDAQLARDVIVALFDAAHPAATPSDLVAACIQKRSADRDKARQPWWAQWEAACRSDGGVRELLVAAVQGRLKPLLQPRADWSATAPQVGSAIATLVNAFGSDILRELVPAQAVSHSLESTLITIQTLEADRPRPYPDARRCCSGLLPSMLLRNPSVESFSEKNRPWALWVNILGATASRCPALFAEEAWVWLAALLLEGHVLLADGQSIFSEASVPAVESLGAAINGLDITVLHNLLSVLVKRTQSDPSAAMCGALRNVAGALLRQGQDAPLVALLADENLPAMVPAAMSIMEVLGDKWPAPSREAFCVQWLGQLEAQSRVDRRTSALLAIVSEAVSLSVLCAEHAGRLVAVLMKWRESDEDFLAADAPDLAICVEAAKVCKLWLRFCTVGGAADVWDFVLCNALVWLAADMGQPLTRALAGSSASIFVMVAASTERPPEWEDFFWPAASQALLPQFLATATLAATASNLRVIDALSDGAHLIKAEALGVEAQGLLVTILSRPVLVRKPLVMCAHRVQSGQMAALALLDRCIALALPPKSVWESLVAHIQARAAPAAAAAFAKDTSAGQDVLGATSVLAAWLVLLRLLQRAELAAAVRGDIFERVIDIVFDFLPTSATTESLASGLSAKFAFRSVTPTPSGLANFAAHVYWKTLSTVPSMARAWWEDSCPPKLANRIGSFTARVVSPRIIAAEFEAINACVNKPDGLSVRTHQQAREVMATYRIDEVNMDAVILLPEQYPFGPIQVSGNIDIMASRQRNWNLQMQTFLMMQNGSIMDALVTWTNNVSKHFSEANQCVICYAVVHPSTHLLPDKKCRTCKNMFHAACLFKWFSTSGQSTCPLCRSLF